MSEPEAIGASIEQLRVECIGMALAQDQLTIAQRLELAAHLVALMENGASLQPTSAGEAWPKVNTPRELVQSIKRETVAEAIKAARDDVMIPAPPPAAAAVGGAFSLASMPRWSDARKTLMFNLLAGASAPWHGIGWAVLAEKVSALPGPGVTGAQARDWWAKTGAAQFERAASGQQVAAE